ncbi:hypothetical protein SUGI_0983370 [Cryptomeria japonica]|uniref:homeobox-leucine zipper protein ATHB-16 n=1 Tax=Cryptomeria japonica TaxID=3369 RepID=UPI002414C75C|nr:homeobox-leucine zipper protein ATHB-16 [Cryptomeria japonica]GLJ46656.1 hypothetical protein SUGI_0983370 [Cryptomeria japonica]
METPESLDTLISMVARPEDFEEEQYNRGFQNMEETGDEEELSGGGGAQMKKRRLSLQQVRSLEKNFEVENKLEPDRKMQLAKELGLQPRQVAVWFQNRRARWKTKQLERDYGVLKHNYDTLKSSFDAMHRENQKLTAELSSVRKKVEDAGKKKGNVPQRDENNNVDTKIGIRAVAMKQEDYEEEDEGGLVESKVMNGVIVFNERLEGSESDSSAILNDNGGGGAGENNSPHPIDSYICKTSLKYNASYMQPSANHNDNDNKSTGEGLMEAFRPGNNNNTPCAAAYNPQQCFRMDEAEESCNFFNVDDSAAATLPWWEWP